MATRSACLGLALGASLLSSAPGAQGLPEEAFAIAPPADAATASVGADDRRTLGLQIDPALSSPPSETALATPLPALPETPGADELRGEAPPAGVRPPVTGDPVLKLGVGDAVNVQVFNRPEFNTTAYVADDQTITVPLAGAVRVGGLSPADAAQRVAAALRDGQFLVNPQVSLTLAQFRSQQVSVLGEVHNPGRFPLESRTSLLDLLAQAGGIAETGSDVIYLIRPNADGTTTRREIGLRGLTDGSGPTPLLLLRGGDTLYVPRAEQFFVYGEVQNPNMYRLDPGTTVVQAIARSGGLTPRGSDSRIVIQRRNADGGFRTIDGHLTDTVQAGDVIRVKERLF